MSCLESFEALSKQERYMLANIIIGVSLAVAIGGIFTVILSGPRHKIALTACAAMCLSVVTLMIGVALLPGAFLPAAHDCHAAWS